MVLRRINSLRSAYRREFRRTKENDAYISSLWYFSLFAFLQNANDFAEEVNYISDSESGDEKYLLQNEDLNENNVDMVTLLEVNSPNDVFEEINIEENSLDPEEEQNFDFVGYGKKSKAY